MTADSVELREIDDERLAVHLGKRFLLITPMLAAGSIAVVVWVPPAWPLGVAALLCVALVVVRYLDPRPEAVITSAGVHFGGLCKSAPVRDVWVPWSAVKSVGKPRSEYVELHLTQRTPIVPEIESRFLRRITPETVAVKTTDGRCYKVSSPGRGVSLEQVYAEMIRRWTASASD